MVKKQLEPAGCQNFIALLEWFWVLQSEDTVITISICSCCGGFGLGAAYGSAQRPLPVILRGSDAIWGNRPASAAWKAAPYSLSLYLVSNCILIIVVYPLASSHLEQNSIIGNFIYMHTKYMFTHWTKSAD